jgi:hypothetical protein
MSLEITDELIETQNLCDTTKILGEDSIDEVKVITTKKDDIDDNVKVKKEPKKRGRPRKHPIKEKSGRGRGRPKKLDKYYKDNEFDNKQYYQDNKERIKDRMSTKIKCDSCHKMIRRDHLTNHKRTNLCKKNSALI